MTSLVSSLELPGRVSYLSGFGSLFSFLPFPIQDFRYRHRHLLFAIALPPFLSSLSLPRIAASTGIAEVPFNTPFQKVAV